MCADTENSSDINVSIMVTFLYRIIVQLWSRSVSPCRELTVQKIMIIEEM